MYRLLVGIVFFYAIVNWSSTSTRNGYLVTGIFLTGLGLSALATVSVDWTIGKITLIPASIYQYFSILVSDQINPNVLAGSLVLLFPVPAAILAFNWKGMTRVNRLLASVSALAMLLMIMLSQSRSAWIALGVSLLVLAALRWRWGWVVGLSTVIVMIVTMQWFRASTLGFYMLGGFQGVINTRIGIWSRAVYLLKNLPISGIGFGNFPEFTSIFYPLQESGGNAIPHAHNLYLQIGLDMGMPGMLSWLAVWMAVIACAWNLIKHSKGSQPEFKGQYQLLRGAAAGLFASQIALGVNGVVDVLIWGMVRSAPLVWGLWGVVIVWYLGMEKHD